MRLSVDFQQFNYLLLLGIQKWTLCGFLKLFPAEAVGGLALLRSLAPVFPGIAFCPTGGIDERSAAEYLALPNVPLVGGSWMAPSEAVVAGDWATVRRLAERAAAIECRRTA